MFHPQRFFDSKVDVFKEPCGLSVQECCEMSFRYALEESPIDAFELDDAGCCLLISRALVEAHDSGAPLRSGRQARGAGHLTGRSGTGMLFV